MGTMKFNEQAKCDKCPKIGAYDMTSAMLCGDCLPWIDGGPAFPVPGYSGSGFNNTTIVQEPFPGMTLRDWFAGQVMFGLAANPALFNELKEVQMPANEEHRTYAQTSYRMADAMIAARNNTFPPAAK